VNRDSVAAVMDSHVAGEQRQDVSHLQKVEQELIWLRRFALAGWAIVLVIQGYSPGLSAEWGVYLGGVGYMLVLHWLVRTAKSPKGTAWFGTLADPLLIFCMSAATGGIDSTFVPFFYFTTIATAFRFRDRETFAVLAFHVLLVVVLVFVTKSAESAALSIYFVLFGLMFATGLGRLMASWARESVDKAMAQTTALRQERDRSRGLLRKLIDVQEVERKQIAGDLHDRMGARLSTLQLGMERLSSDDAQVAEELQRLSAELNECTADVRALMNDLRPTVLDELGLYEAVTEYLSHLGDIVEFDIRSDIDPALKDWRSKQDAMLFRLIQEALLNVRKHASAQTVSVRWSIQQNRVVLVIEDDGCGFDPDNVPSGHYGLLTMRERAEAAGGRLAISSGAAQGTQIRVEFDQGTS
jgi:two-component system NarL family sensor kinase